MTVKATISIDVPDLVQAQGFYQEALGCTKVKDQGSDMVVLAAGDCRIYLLKRDADTHPLPDGAGRRSYARHWTPVHLDFLTEDLDEAVQRVLRLGGTHEGGETGDWGSIAYCADPFGNGFCLIDE